VNQRIRIVLADDHPLLLTGVRNLIQTEPDLEIVGEASTGLEALRVIRTAKPDLAVLDVTMPELNGILLGRRLASEASTVKVIVLTLHEDRAFIKQALNAGAKGYILKRSAAENLVQAIRAVVSGGMYIDPAIASDFVNSPRRPRQNNFALTSELSEREAEVLRLVALGFTNKEIAHKLDIGIKSIETHRARGSEKLGLSMRSELVRYAAAQGWLADV
jgi:DNA-binding NarL/FixJ family response regulator